jgi:uncharacterized protein
MFIIYFSVALIASTIGSVSGIGGGVIIKPVLDAFGTMSLPMINFLSGSTVFAMAISAFIRNMQDHEPINYKVSVQLALGASLGGIVGKSSFCLFSSDLELIQSIMLLVINVLVLTYILNKKRISTCRTNHVSTCITIGVVLGFISSFLGIGGGPVNIAILYYFFSMTPKETVRNSLFIILFSQFTSLSTTYLSGEIPLYDPMIFAFMCIGGISGSIAGARMSKKINEKQTEGYFLYLLLFLIALNLYNVINVI